MFAVRTEKEEAVASKYMQLHELADRFGVTTRTVFKWLNDESVGLPRPVFIQRRNYFDREQITAWEVEQVKKIGKAA